MNKRQLLSAIRKAKIVYVSALITSDDVDYIRVYKDQITQMIKRTYDDDVEVEVSFNEERSALYIN